MLARSTTIQGLKYIDENVNAISQIPIRRVRFEKGLKTMRPNEKLLVNCVAMKNA